MPPGETGIVTGRFRKPSCVASAFSAGIDSPSLHHVKSQIVRRTCLRLRRLVRALGSIRHNGVTMSFDAATVSAFLVFLVIFVFLLYSIRASEKRTEAKIRRVARQSTLLNESEFARELCQVVRKQYPDACPGLDFVLYEDDEGVHIDAWFLPHPEPDTRRILKK